MRGVTPQRLSVTATGAQASVDIQKFVNASFNCSVTGLVTNIVARAEYSLDGGTTWTNINASDTTITTNNSQFIIPILRDGISLPRVRFNLVTITGGTPTVTVTLRGVTV